MREAFPHNHSSLGHSIIANLGIEVPQKNNGILRWYPLQDATQRLREGRVTLAVNCCICANNSQNQHRGTQMGAREYPHTCPTPL